MSLYDEYVNVSRVISESNRKTRLDYIESQLHARTIAHMAWYITHDRNGNKKRKRKEKKKKNLRSILPQYRNHPHKTSLRIPRLSRFLKHLRRSTVSRFTKTFKISKFRMCLSNEKVAYNVIRSLERLKLWSHRYQSPTG